jgi:hypothetical protein
MWVMVSLGDIEQVATEFIEMVKVARALDLGSVSDITIKAERGTLLARFLSEGYFAVVLMSDTGNFGKGRWVLRNAATSSWPACNPGDAPRTAAAAGARDSRAQPQFAR